MSKSPSKETVSLHSEMIPFLEKEVPGWREDPWSSTLYQAKMGHLRAVDAIIHLCDCVPFSGWQKLAEVGAKYGHPSIVRLAAENHNLNWNRIMNISTHFANEKLLSPLYINYVENVDLPVNNDEYVSAVTEHRNATYENFSDEYPFDIHSVEFTEDTNASDAFIPFASQFRDTLP